MKKILIVSSVCGFLAKFEKEDVKILQELGYEVHYASNSSNPIYPYPEDTLEKMGVIFHDTDLWQSPFGITHNLKALRQIKGIVKREGIGVVHCHTPSGGLVGRLACKSEKVYMIYTAHGFHFYKGADFLHYHLYHGIEKFLSRMTDVIVTVNQEDFSAAEKMKEKVCACRIPGVGLDMDYFHGTSREQRAKARKNLGLKQEFYLLSVGELRENKNQSAVIKALAKLREEGADIKKIRYGMLGAGRQEQELREMVRNLHLDGQVEFLGYRQDVRPYLQAADALVFPSVREGLGMAALEALATGLPVIASDNRGTREYMLHGENGLVSKRNTPEEYAALIKKMAEEREDWGENFARRERIRKGVEKFEKHNSMAVMRRVYENACD